MDDRLWDLPAQWQYSSQRQEKDSPSKQTKDSRIQANIAENRNGEASETFGNATLKPCVTSRVNLHFYYAVSICSYKG